MFINKVFDDFKDVNFKVDKFVSEIFFKKLGKGDKVSEDQKVEVKFGGVNVNEIVQVQKFVDDVNKGEEKIEEKKEEGFEQKQQDFEEGIFSVEDIKYSIV